MTGELRRFGYTPREAGFLMLAGLQSGYFLRSQFNAHIERECGALGQRFIDRALRLGHIRVLPGFGNQRLYHVCARAVYQNIGEPDNRNRRLHAPETVRQRLMMLDYVLARPGEHWLLSRAARRESVSRLVLQNSIDVDSRLADELPADRQPISLDAAGGMQLGFVDEGLSGFSKWERFLRRRRPLLRTADAATVTYATCSAVRFRNAETVFRKMVGEHAGSGGVDRGRLKGYFTDRRLFEERRFESFDKTRLDRLREDQRTFAGEVFEDLYRHWRRDGDAALAGCVATTARFETQLLPSAYTWLAPIRFQERRVHRGPDSGADQESS
jgi:hypothetical protein